MSGAPNPSGGYSGSGYAGRGGPPPPRSFEERAAAKEQMMQSVRDSSQQDRRVYVGNLAYDVKWHHLKDFMRQGTPSGRPCQRSISSGDGGGERHVLIGHGETAGGGIFADVLLLPNGMSKVGANV